MNVDLENAVFDFEGNLERFAYCLEDSITKSVQKALQGDGVLADEDHDDSWLYDAICRCRENYLRSIANRRNP